MKMRNLRQSALLREFKKSKGGMIGIGLILFLVGISIYAFVAVPLQSFYQWNNPGYWIDYPKSAAPAWTNFLSLNQKIPEHMVFDDSAAQREQSINNGIRTVSYSFKINYNFDSFPSDMMFPFSVRYGNIQPIVKIEVTRPDGETFLWYESSLPSLGSSSGQDNNDSRQHNSRIFSTDRSISENLAYYRSYFVYSQDPTQPASMTFAQKDKKAVLKGEYIVKQSFLLFQNSDMVVDTGLVVGGKVYGLMGTDDMRRDLSIGLVWGAPVALFIGVTVAVSSVVIGLTYGVISGYKGRTIDEVMMRTNDIVLSLPFLPILIILSLSFGNSIFIVTGLLILLSWAGSAKINRSLALQIKNFQYVEAARLMGQSDIKIIFKHIVPRLLPLAFASMAISVPAAILTEAGLSFLGLGDPSIPTWGQMLHESKTASATTRGLWWWMVAPGIMISITGLAFALIGNTLEKIANPRLKKVT